jgi:ribosomal protein L7Ae-like RNA K-turn-binding protein
MDKALNYVALARKAGRIEVGEEPVGAAARAQHARLVIVASDASDHSWRRAKSFVAGTKQQCIRLPYTKDELGQAVVRQSLAMAAFTDTAMALAFAKALEKVDPQVLEELEVRTRRVQQRQQEEKAHERNKRLGKPKRKPAAVKKD